VRGGSRAAPPARPGSCFGDGVPRLVPNPLFGMATQMANFVYLVADGASGQCATCWDRAGVKRAADELGALTIVAAWYTHKHFDHGGGAVPERMTGGAKVTLEEGAQDMAALGAEVLVGSADAAELQAQCGLAALTPLSRTARS
jgi:glyoxylase-like metal-dependent hydrolase (beta-lactamase superfamily II)